LSARENINRVGRFLIRQLFDFEVHGLENIPEAGRLLLYINHINIFDPILACALVQRHVVPLSKEENFHIPIIGEIAKAYGVIPIRRGEVDTTAFKSSLAVLHDEKVLLVAPEGTRSGDGRLQEAKDGPTLMALRTNAPLVPVSLVGQENAPTRWKRLRKTRVAVWVGRPFRFLAAQGTRIPRPELKAMTTDAMRELAALLPAANRGVYAAGVNEPRQWITYDV